MGLNKEERGKKIRDNSSELSHFFLFPNPGLVAAFLEPAGDREAEPQKGQSQQHSGDGKKIHGN
jgi:hypothetical protein